MSDSKESSQEWLETQGFLVDQIRKEFYKDPGYGPKIVIPFDALEKHTRTSFIAKAKARGWVLLTLCLFLDSPLTIML